MYMPMDGSPCDDGNACTQGDQCMAGTCVGMDMDCDDGNPCTDEFCDSGMGCVYVPNSNPCDDGNVCTAMDVCAAGACMGGMPMDCDDGNECTNEFCDPGMGCQYSDEDDGNPCAGTSGFCMGGSCDICECWMPDMYCDGDEAVWCVSDGIGCGTYQVTESCEPGMCADGECQG